MLDYNQRKPVTTVCIIPSTYSRPRSPAIRLSDKAAEGAPNPFSSKPGTSPDLLYRSTQRNTCEHV